MRTLLRATLFIAFGALLHMAVVEVSRAYPPVLEDWWLVRQAEEALTDPGGVEVLVIGNSHARESIEPGLLGTGSLILGLPLNDLAEVEHQARTVAPRLPALRTAYIGISYFSFHWTNDAGIDPFLLYGRKTFHAVYPGWRPVGLDLASLIEGKSYWVARPDHWRRAFEEMRAETPSYAEESDARRALLLEPLADSVLARMATERIAYKQAYEKEMVRLTPGLARQNYDRLASTVRYLQQRGIRVVLFTPPYYFRYRDGYRDWPHTAEQRELTNRLVRETGVDYFDFSDHEMGDDPRWWRDGDHVNLHGRPLVTRMLLEAAGKPGTIPTAASR